MNCWIRFVLLALLLATAGPTLAAAAPGLPGDSVYRLDVPLTTQEGTALRFPALRGEVRIVSMFYANCPYVCPLIVETLRGVEDRLSEAERARLQVLLVSLDPDRDDPAALAALARQRKLDLGRWMLARTPAPDVRKLAAVLGIQYRQLENREFNHSSALVLLDGEGRVLARSDRLGTPDPEFVAKVRAALAPR